MNKHAREVPLRRELKCLASRVGRWSDDPHTAELDYHLTRLTAATNSFRSSHFSLYSHHERSELLAQLDSLLSQISELREVEHAREVLLRPPPEERAPDLIE